MFQKGECLVKAKPEPLHSDGYGWYHSIAMATGGKGRLSVVCLLDLYHYFSSLSRPAAVAPSLVARFSSCVRGLC